MFERQVPADDLITLAQQLVNEPPSREHNPDLRHYMNGVQQGKRLAARDLMRLLREYDIELPPALIHDVEP